MSAVPILYASGTQSATVPTEHFLSSPNVAGVFSFHVDKINMAAGDTLELRIYRILLTGGTTRVMYIARFTDAQPVDDMIAESPVIGNDLTDTNSLRFSLNQTTGTSRNFPWKVLQY